MIDGRHIYQGDCPDDDNGPYSRDPDCPVCRALMKVDLYEQALDLYKLALTKAVNLPKGQLPHEPGKYYSAMINGIVYVKEEP